MRAFAFTLLAATVVSPTLAQEEGDEVTSTAVLFTQQGATRAQASTITIGLRRGVAEVEGVRFVHPVDALSTPPSSDALFDALDGLDAVADQVRSGNAREAAQRADQITAVFEENLAGVRRAELVDAYVLAAVARCQAGDRRGCEQRMAAVIAFREGLTYDAERYPPAFEEVFQRVQARALSGARGTLVVDSDPPGAEIYIDGRSYGAAPVRAEGLLAGQHYVTLKSLGFERMEVRAEVAPNGETEEVYSLSPSERSQLVVSTFAQASIRAELGEAQAGANLRSLGNTLGTTQVMVGLLRPAAGGRVQVQLYLYHLTTRFLQAQQEITVLPDEAGMERVRQMVVDLYDGVDLGGTIEAPEIAELEVQENPSLAEQWWFWVALVGGVGLVGGAIGVGVAVSGSDVPAGFLRVEGQLP